MITVNIGGTEYVSTAIALAGAKSTKSGLLLVAFSGGAAIGQAGTAYFNENVGSNGLLLFTGCEL